MIVALNSSKKKKRGQRAVAGDKSGRGLRQFSMKGFVLNAVLSYLISIYIVFFLPKRWFIFATYELF